MKVYFIKHSGVKTRPLNLDAWGDCDFTPNGVYVRSVRAFLKKKHAKEYIEELCKNSQYLSPKDREIVTVEL